MTPPASAVAAPAGRAAPMPRRRVPVRHPRRVSGPTRAVRPASPAPVVARPGPVIAVLDRLIHGRLWIGLLAFSLIGIVAMQLVVLKLNTGIGHTLTREATLQRENAQLGIEDSMYSAESRVAPLAAAAGMTLAPPGTVHFVKAVPTDVSRAAAALLAPIQGSANSQRSSPTETAAAAPESSEATSGSSSTEPPGAASAGGEAAASSTTVAPLTSETGGSTETSNSSSGAGG